MIKRSEVSSGPLWSARMNPSPSFLNRSFVIALASFALGACMALGLALMAGGAAAEGGFSFGATPGKLPKTVVPIHYALDLAPDLDKLTFAYSEAVDRE